MKVIAHIICEDIEEFDRGEQIVCAIYKSARYDDIVKANICIVSPHMEVTNDGEE